jgi:hypothetical protein
VSSLSSPACCPQQPWQRAINMQWLQGCLPPNAPLSNQSTAFPMPWSLLSHDGQHGPRNGLHEPSRWAGQLEPTTESEVQSKPLSESLSAKLWFCVLWCGHQDLQKL